MECRSHPHQREAVSRPSRSRCCAQILSTQRLRLRHLAFPGPVRGPHLPTGQATVSKPCNSTGCSAVVRVRPMPKIPRGECFSVPCIEALIGGGGVGGLTTALMLHARGRPMIARFTSKRER